MKKEEIISNIENLPSDIDGYKLCIYEIIILEPWGLVCMHGKFNKAKLLDIFDNDGKIKHYDFGDNLEYQFAVDYEKNEQLLFDESNCGSLENCLTNILIKITEYKNKQKTDSDLLERQKSTSNSDS